MMVENRQTHMAFVAANWELMAAMAWHNYQESGRGFILFNSGWCKTEDEWIQGQTPGTYVPENEFGESWLVDVDPALYRMVREYDPGKEIIVAFARLDGGMSFYRIKPANRPSPVEAYARMGYQLKEFILGEDEL